MQELKQNQANQTISAQEVSVSISAWMDGDDQATMPDILVTEQGKETWELYHLIGDTLRTPELALPPVTEFSSRVSQAIAAEPTILAPRTQTPKPNTGWVRRYGWPGFAMAAAVASVVWVARPFFVPEMVTPVGQVAVSTPASVLASSLDPKTVQPYVNAHRQVSGPAAVRQVSFGAAQ
ncbi:MAG: RseA family anti-sigma factor [Sheuella sp.]|nr:RseA family anti-sigma factor [Sheuella sp.]